MAHRESPKSAIQPARPDVVEVIDRAALIENLLNQVIVGYCRPPKDAWEFMWSVLLDTSVMPLGAKVRVVLAIAQELHLAIEKDALHSVIALRNAFAHHATHAHPVLTEPSKKGKPPVSHNELWVLGSSGKIKKIPRPIALAEFNEKYSLARTSLLHVNDVILQRFHESAA